uniref:Uncharacterized protein n=1 Tax=Pristionchus pacificus TaxID=54126 RepID=A0A2A6BXL3_PRIPA|eukprot:PDM70664.1 hypothetical protein PRIPAC_43869 [Pristionchus pacificus]
MRREEGEMRQYRNYSLIPSEEETIKGKETTLSEMEKWLEKERTLQKLDTTLVRLSSKVTSSDEIGQDTREILI